MMARGRAIKQLASCQTLDPDAGMTWQAVDKLDQKRQEYLDATDGPRRGGGQGNLDRHIQSRRQADLKLRCPDIRTLPPGYAVERDVRHDGWNEYQRESAGATGSGNQQSPDGRDNSPPGSGGFGQPNGNGPGVSGGLGQPGGGGWGPGGFGPPNGGPPSGGPPNGGPFGGNFPRRNGPGGGPPGGRGSQPDDEAWSADGSGFGTAAFYRGGMPMCRYYNDMARSAQGMAQDSRARSDREMMDNFRLSKPLP